MDRGGVDKGRAFISTVKEKAAGQVQARAAYRAVVTAIAGSLVSVRPATATVGETRQLARLAGPNVAVGDEGVCLMTDGGYPVFAKTGGAEGSSELPSTVVRTDIINAAMQYRLVIDTSSSGALQVRSATSVPCFAVNTTNKHVNLFDGSILKLHSDTAGAALKAEINGATGAASFASLLVGGDPVGATPETQVLGPGSFMLGGATLMADGNAPALVFPDGSSQFSYNTFRVPDGAPNLTAVGVFYRASSATTGNFTVFIDAVKIKAPAAYPAASDTVGYYLAATGSIERATAFTAAFNGLALEAGDVVGFRLYRSGNHSGDTATGDMRVYAFYVVFTP